MSELVGEDVEIECSRCKYNFDPNRESPGNPFRCEKCGELHERSDIYIPQYVYLINDSRGYVKIGISTRPKQRLKSLQTGSGTKLELLTAVECTRPKDIETELHKTFKDVRKCGEWFELSEQEKGHAERALVNMATNE